jgi:outer membrane protein assembly factor BamD (BamD/ComL family)
MKKYLIVVAVSIFILSCSNGKEKKLTELKDLEKAVSANPLAPIDFKKAKELVNAYTDFVKEFPEDSGAASYLFKAANIAMNIGQPKVSIDLFDQIIKEYPKFNKIPDCYFLKAFVYDDKLKNITKAREAYENFLRKFPNHDFADDARSCIDNLGKTPEQLIKEFEKKQHSDSLASKK